ncbi:MAG TPA: hypothetical protein VMZ53_03645 [Kofleriaceae bacterium]|nr:hypothetical protein [Kofleriaceae bacterium]
MTDPGDENDHPETDAEWIAWLKRELARAADRGSRGQTLTPAQLIGAQRGVLAYPITGGENQDPGDESDAPIRVWLRKLTVTVEL